MKITNLPLMLLIKHTGCRRLKPIINSVFFLNLFLFLSFRLDAQTQYDELWGMTKAGGENNCGVIFKYNIKTATISKILDFDDLNKGKYPQCGLVFASNGKFYGVTKYGGAYDQGTLFEYDPQTLIFVKKIDFDGKNKGQLPCGSLIQVSDGNLYGTTLKGGKNDAGTLFVYNLQSGQLIKKIDFNGTETGDSPYASLIEASNSVLYGTTINGGKNNEGVLFSFDPSTNCFKKLVNFDDDINGKGPKGSLMQASNGNIYGTTTMGGEQNNGIIFEYDPKTNKLLAKCDFTTNNGQFPAGGLICATNQKFYGTTYWGGANDAGVLFEYNPETERITNKIDFDGPMKGRSAQGCLMQDQNGKLYGVTTYGGINDLGVLFEYDTSNGTFKKVIDFDGTNGAYPVALKLIEAVDSHSKESNEETGHNDSSIVIVPNPSHGIIKIKGIMKESDTIDIIDCEGKVVNFERVDEQTLNISPLVPGIYFIRIGTQVVRVVKI